MSDVRISARRLLDHVCADSNMVCFMVQVQAWKVADQLLHAKRDVNSCFFAAQTLRTKIQVCWFCNVHVYMYIMFALLYSTHLYIYYVCFTTYLTLIGIILTCLNRMTYIIPLSAVVLRRAAGGSACITSCVDVGTPRPHHRTHIPGHCYPAVCGLGWPGTTHGVMGGPYWWVNTQSEYPRVIGYHLLCPPQ